MTTSEIFSFTDGAVRYPPSIWTMVLTQTPLEDIKNYVRDHPEALLQPLTDKSRISFAHHLKMNRTTAEGFHLGHLLMFLDDVTPAMLEQWFEAFGADIFLRVTDQGICPVALMTRLAKSPGHHLEEYRTNKLLTVLRLTGLSLDDFLARAHILVPTGNSTVAHRKSQLALKQHFANSDTTGLRQKYGHGHFGYLYCS